VLWPARRPDAFLSDTTTALLAGDLVISHKRPDRLVGLEAQTGKQLWEAERAVSTMHSLTLCGDGFFAFTDQGELIRARLSAESYQETGRTHLLPAGGKTYSAPAYANGHIFVRNDQELICARLVAP
jgi:hypothetical protein